MKKYFLLLLACAGSLIGMEEGNNKGVSSIFKIEKSGNELKLSSFAFLTTNIFHQGKIDLLYLKTQFLVDYSKYLKTLLLVDHSKVVNLERDTKDRSDAFKEDITKISKVNESEEVLTISARYSVEKDGLNQEIKKTAMLKMLRKVKREKDNKNYFYSIENNTVKPVEEQKTLNAIQDRFNFNDEIKKFGLEVKTDSLFPDITFDAAYIS